MVVEQLGKSREMTKGLLPEKPLVTFDGSSMYEPASRHHATNPVELNLEQGTVAFPTMPEATKLKELNTADALRLAEFAIHEHSLIEAEAAVAALQKMEEGERGQGLGRALWTGMAVSYCRCFADTPYHLDPAAVFLGQPLGLEAHQLLWTKRSKHYAHDINIQRKSIVAIAIDGSGRLHGLNMWQGIAEPDDTDLHNAMLLVHTALKHVRAERQLLEDAVTHAAGAMLPTARLALPDPVIPSLQIARLKGSRRNSSV